MGGFCAQLCARATRVTAYGASTPSGTSLHRRLGKLDVTLVGVGASIGAGIFVVSGEAARLAGPSVILSFFVSSVVCMLNALCYAEMASRIPVSGSAYVYASAVFGEGLAIITGINLLFDYHIGAALIARNLMHYVINFLEVCGVQRVPTWLESISLPLAPFFSFSFTAPLVLALLACVLCKGIHESAKVNNILTSLKCLIVVFVIVSGLSKLNTDNLSPFAPKGASAVFEASSLCFFAFIGFDAVCNTAEEAIQPSKTLPFGIIASLLFCAALYSGVTLVLTGLIPFDKLPADASLSEAFSGIPGMGWVKIVIDVGAIIGLTTTLFLGIYSQSRMYLAIARDGLLPECIARIHPESGAPRNATLLSACVACVLAAFFDVEKLSRLLDMGILVSYSVVSSAVLILRADSAPVQLDSTEVQQQLQLQRGADVEERLLPLDYDGGGGGGGGRRGGGGGRRRDGGGGDGDANELLFVQACRQNRWRAVVACIALTLAPLFPGFAIANKWSWVSSTVLILYSVAAGGLCVFFVWHVDFAADASKSEAYQSDGDVPFSTPYASITASFALAANAYLLSQRPVEGWMRLLGISALVSVCYVISVFRSEAESMHSTRVGVN
jgi:APA family basic amino acid/polyamine antiporter